MISIKLLGIAATPIKEGNCENIVRYALEAAQELGDVDTEFISMAGKDVKACIHCQWCIENRAPCKFEDDVHSIFESIENCDGIIMGSPAWLNTLSPFLLNLFSRARYQVFFTNNFRNRVAGLLTVGFFGFGMEHAIDVMQNVVSCFNIISVADGSALCSTRVFDQRPAYLERGVLDHSQGLAQTKLVATRVVEVSRMMKYAREAGVGLPDELQRTVVGGKPLAKEKQVFRKGVWRSNT